MLSVAGRLTFTSWAAAAVSARISLPECCSTCRRSVAHSMLMGYLRLLSRAIPHTSVLMGVFGAEKLLLQCHS